MTTYTLDCGVQRKREFPETFEIPAAEERENLQPGQLVKLMFRIDQDGDVTVERLWVIVQERQPGYYVGVLDNEPTCTDELEAGMRVRFAPRHVIQIWREQ